MPARRGCRRPLARRPTAPDDAGQASQEASLLSVLDRAPNPRGGGVSNGPGNSSRPTLAPTCLPAPASPRLAHRLNERNDGRLLSADHAVAAVTLTCAPQGEAASASQYCVS